ncbi:hypothetical protein CBS147317_9079 [Penicillium roqueforti]|nr:hypothetical protein CBS147372_8394 [Penicillium roqueforti]KAI3120167.1 hypothetical protein CBS147330_8407 [Penicillium roqueforti]KAI3146745.1 hypothetical protein CBS147317_9079 [Penicillium roqueforti]KAI3267431.1 hypothetical protein CBS147309_6051 [Penicillium roqueforti]
MMVHSTGRKPSSSTDGFFQSIPTVPPAYTFVNDGSANSSSLAASDDIALARILNLYLPRESPVGVSVHNLSRRALDPAILNLATDAEVNQPIIRPLSTFGIQNRVDPLITGEGWRKLTAIAQEEGLVAVAYKKSNEQWNRRVQQFAMNHVWSPSAAMTGCPGSMTDGAAKLLAARLDDVDGDQPGRRAVLQEAYRRLVSDIPGEAWTTGQWMTERTGGSDVRETETLAWRLTAEEISRDAEQGRDVDAHGLQLGPWRIDGFKWFSSATDSDMAMLLAQTEKGLSLFLAPMRRRSGKNSDASELNGIRIQRLKSKLGTKSLPTAELELKGVRGWLVGEEGKGVNAISTVLNITRLYCAGVSAAGWGRGLSICRAYTRVRKTRGALLQDNVQHVRWMADETVNYSAAMHLAFFGVALQGTMEQNWDSMVRSTKAAGLIPQDPVKAATLLRLITPALKATVSVNAVHGLRACMECLGGVGYCENNEDGGILNIAKIFRDTTVNAIWEGTVSVMAEDVIRVLTDKRLQGKKSAGSVLVEWTKDILKGCQSRFAEECVTVEGRLNALLEITQSTNRDELLWRDREILQHIAAIVSSCLVLYDASSDGDERATQIASRWVRSQALAGTKDALKSSWQHESAIDRLIFLGESTSVSRSAKI